MGLRLVTGISVFPSPGKGGMLNLKEGGKRSRALCLGLQEWKQRALVGLGITDLVGKLDMERLMSEKLNLNLCTNECLLLRTTAFNTKDAENPATKIEDL